MYVCVAVYYLSCVVEVRYSAEENDNLNIAGLNTH